MLGICSACGNTEWDKEVTGNVIKCPKCGNEWKFDKLPIFFRIRQITRLPKKVSPPDRGGES